MFNFTGLKIFQARYFHHFKRSNLNIEDDFGYDKRDDLKKQIGLSDEKIDKIFSTPWEFIMFLCPATTSPMIKNEKDFVAIADYLYFMHVSTKSYETAAITKKALFSLLKNYGYSWKFGLRHVVPTLLNLGMEESTILVQDNYDDMLRLSKPKTKGFDLKIEDVQPAFFKKRFQLGGTVLYQIVIIRNCYFCHWGMQILLDCLFLFLSSWCSSKLKNSSK